MNREFSVYQWFAGSLQYEEVLRFVDAETAVQKARSLSMSIGAAIGTTQFIRISDGGDSTVFEWEYGKGVTFPPQHLAVRGERK